MRLAASELNGERRARVPRFACAPRDIRTFFRQLAARHHLGEDQSRPASLGEVAERLIADTGHGSEQNTITQPQMADRYAHILGTNQVWAFFMQLSNRSKTVK
jgi:hypothetical protein